MRKKIDRLSLFNAVWLLIVLLEIWINTNVFAIIGLICATATLVYEIKVYTSIKNRVEEDARERLHKRAKQSMYHSAIIILIFATLLIK